jgi:hypothetical protein
MSGSQNPFAQANKSDPKNDMTGTWPALAQPTAFDWARVDGAILKAACQASSIAGKSFGIGPAMGGRGVVITVYLGLKNNPKRYAIDASELHPILLAMIATWGSGSEDIVAGMRAGFDTDKPMAAD